MLERGKLKHTCAAVLLLQDVGTQSPVSISNREGPSSSCAGKKTSTRRLKVKVSLGSDLKYAGQTRFRVFRMSNESSESPRTNRGWSVAVHLSHYDTAQYASQAVL
jgi:hypothetical protein